MTTRGVAYRGMANFKNSQNPAVRIKKKMAEITTGGPSTKVV